MKYTLKKRKQVTSASDEQHNGTMKQNNKRYTK
jgi:hypothetical protein